MRLSIGLQCGHQMQEQEVPTGGGQSIQSSFDPGIAARTEHYTERPDRVGSGATAA